MVVKKQEVFDITEDDKPAMEALELRIDKALKSGRNSYTNSVTMASSLFESYDKVVIEAVLAKYTEAGWTVDYTSDQRDGAFYTFR